MISYWLWKKGWSQLKISMLIYAVIAVINIKGYGLLINFNLKMHPLKAVALVIATVFLFLLPRIALDYMGKRLLSLTLYWEAFKKIVLNGELAIGGIIFPLLEEVLLRGIILRILISRLTTTNAIMVLAGIDFIAHVLLDIDTYYNLITCSKFRDYISWILTYMYGYIGFAVLSSLLYTETGTIWAAWLAHCSGNTITFTVTYYRII